jgi:hypothetical protein
MEINGRTIRRLMRIHKVTIRGLAARYQITLKRVREVRAKGVSGFSGDEWFMLITGKWPDQSAAADLLRVARMNREAGRS